MSRRPAYSLKIVKAILANDQDGTNQAICDCIEDMTGQLTELMRQYDMLDLPMFVASMRLLDKGLDPVLDDSGRQLVTNLMGRTSCITIDVDEMLRQKRQQTDGHEK